MSRKILSTADVLLALGITPNLKGFNVIIDMVDLLNSGKYTRFNDMYAALSDKYGTKVSAVERSIRFATTKIDVNSETYKKYIGADLTNKSGKIVNTVFIHTLAHRIKEGISDE